MQNAQCGIAPQIFAFTGYKPLLQIPRISINNNLFINNDAETSYNLSIQHGLCGYFNRKT